MKREERLILFINAVLAMAKLENINDSFFSRRLQDFLKKFLVRGIASWQENDNDIAQYLARKDLIALVREINEFLEELKYLNLIRPASLLLVRRALMHFYLFEIRSLQLPQPKSDKQPAVAASRASPPQLSKNQEKILGFIKKFQRVRARDVIDEFSVLSQRTVKRNLKELMHNGFIRKREEDRAVYYTPRE